MAIEKIFAHVSCLDFRTSAEWYAKLFARSADAQPMQGLAEWHYGTQAGMQLYEDAVNAGKSTLTLIASGLKEEHVRLLKAGLNPEELESSDTVSLVRLRDPDGNLVVLAQRGLA